MAKSNTLLWLLGLGAVGAVGYFALKDEKADEKKSPYMGLLDAVAKLPEPPRAATWAVLSKPGVTQAELEATAKSLESNGFKDAAAEVRKYAAARAMAEASKPGASKDMDLSGGDLKKYIDEVKI